MLSPQRKRLGIRIGALVGVTCVLALCLAPAGANAAALPPALWQAPDDGAPGSAAGRLGIGRSIAVDPASGNVYVTDEGNNRIDEFSPFGLFVKAIGWGVADGSSELQTCGPEATPPTATCQGGSFGAEPGQFAFSFGGLAVDTAGNLYVADMGNDRVQKFTSAGAFDWMVGGGVDQGPSNPGNLCTAAFVAGGDSCGAGSAGPALGEFEFVSEGMPLTFSAAGDLMVGDVGRIQEIELSGQPKGTFPDPDNELTGRQVQALAAEPSGDIYVDFTETLGGEDAIKKLGPSGGLSATLVADSPSNLAVDDAGNLYAIVFHLGAELPWEVVEFGPGGEEIIPSGSAFAPPADGGFIQGLAVNTVTNSGEQDVYVVENVFGERSALRAFGALPTKWPLPVHAPEINAQFATEVNSEDATLKAQIKPYFWSDTTYFVQYGTEKCSEGGCTTEHPLPPGALLEATGGFLTTTKPVVIGGLSPATTYHYRFVAQSGGGGPVRGVGPSEMEGSFTTPPLPSRPTTSCPNQSFREGPAARLPDCRGYEMVSPAEKHNSDILSLINISSLPASFEQSTPGGDKLTYSSYRAFGDAVGAPYVSQYIATRDSSGWSSHSISPPQGLTVYPIGRSGESQFRSFSADLCSATLLQFTERLLAPGAVPTPGYPNIYRRQNCGDEGYEAVIPATPPAIGPNPPDVQGTSSDGRCIVFRAAEQLTADAHALEAIAPWQIYESCEGQLRLVSALPSGEAAFGAQVGTGPGSRSAFPMRTVHVKNAVSTDGSRIYWTASDGAGALYLRFNADDPASAIAGEQCSEPERACTVRVARRKARFWAASPDGSKALYTEGENLFAYDATNGVSSLIGGEVLGLLGASEDTSRMYLVSRESLAEGAEAGAPNLYFYDGAVYHFIVQLSSVDVTEEKLSPIDPAPYLHTSYVAPDGRHAVFMSTATVDGYDNTDFENGNPDAEVYRYDAASDGLECVSCNPSGARPHGREIEVKREDASHVWGAAQIGRPNSELYAPRVMSNDGSLVFFESFESLLPGDINEKTDIYEWEAPGFGDCTEASSSYRAPSGGCLSLISSGRSPRDSTFIDASASGSDVFFVTPSSLAPEDEGNADIYDARIDGGFPAPPLSPGACQADACQPSIPPPGDPTPASATFKGAGNLTQNKRARGGHRKHGRHRHKRHEKRKHDNHRQGRKQG